MTYPRFLKEKILKALDVSPIVLLTGGRQTGKTTLMRELAKEKGYDFISLDNLRYLSAAREDPIGMLEQFTAPIIIDEVQRAPELALPMKMKVDEERKPAMYLLTGSSNPLVAPKLNDSLAGRMFIFHLWPLSQAELRQSKPDVLEMLFAKDWCPQKYIRWEHAEMIETLLKGGYPTVQNLAYDMREEWFSQHLRTLLERDIQDLTHIRKLLELPNLLRLLADRTSALMNVSELARTLQIPVSTVTVYLSLLEALFLVVRQPAWHKNMTKKMAKAPKMYLVDTAMIAYLVGADARRLSHDLHLLGRMFETFIVLEILKLMSWCSIRLQSYHFRTASGIEVDMVLENRSGEIVGIEIKMSETVRGEDFKGLRTLQQEVGSNFVRGVVLYPGSDVVAFGENLYALPVMALFV